MSPSSAQELIGTGFDPAPSWASMPTVTVGDATEAEVLGVAVTAEGDVPERLGLSRDDLKAAGFSGKAGETLLLTGPARPSLLAVGVGDPQETTANKLRDIAGAFARATGRFATIATDLADTAVDSADAEATAAVVEGILLARYRYRALKTEPTKQPALEKVILTGSPNPGGLQRGLTLARCALLARDLGNTPPAHLTATRLADVAVRLGAEAGLSVEVFGREALVELGCGGILGVNAASAEEPRMVRLHYKPAEASSAHLALVGKGITYDSGGLSLKPSNPMHALMKLDMSGAAAILAAMVVLHDLECPVEVTGYLMCTDNMPSGSSMKLGDVLTMRGGTTVEVKNTDAEGRLVLADALALASESDASAVVDIATLTGACITALGPHMAGLFATSDELADQVEAAATDSDEPVWRLPLEPRYRDGLNSEVADIANIGGAYGGAITAALFLEKFVGEKPWVHLDIAGPMHFDKDDGWRAKGASGFGARLLAELCCTFTAATSA